MPTNMISKVLEKAVLPLDVAPHVKIGAPGTSVPRNPNMEKLQKGYLFQEISIKHEAHLKKYPDAKVISLGIGDTTQPIPSIVTSAMAEMLELDGAPKLVDYYLVDHPRECDIKMNVQRMSNTSLRWPDFTNYTE